MKASRGAILMAIVMITAPLSAQDGGGAPLPVRLRVSGEVRVGRPAPPVVLPYATQAGHGPADQPFTLAKELGHVVVLVFHPGDFTPGSMAQWRGLRERAATLFPAGVVVVGISTDSLDTHVRFARELDLPFKLTSDPDLSVARSYGAADGSRAKRMTVVVGPGGQVRYVDAAFAVLDPQSYVHLGAAIESAKKESP